MGIWGVIIGKALGGAIGKTIEKVADWVPGKDESIRNQIDKLEREQDELKNKPESGGRDKRLIAIAFQLRILHSKAKNK